MKWHSLLICFPLNLKYASSSVYYFVCESALSALSSEQTLRDYIYWLQWSMVSIWSSSLYPEVPGSHEIGWPKTNIIGQPYEDRTRQHNKNRLTDRAMELIQNYSHLPTSIVTYCITCDLHHCYTLYTMNSHHNTQGVTKQPFLSVDNQKLLECSSCSSSCW